MEDYQIIINAIAIILTIIVLWINVLVIRGMLNKQEENQYNKSIATGFKRMTVLFIALTILGFIVIPPICSCSELNSDLRSFLNQPVNKSTLDRIHEFDKRIAAEGFWGDICIRGTDELEAKRQESNQFIDTTAAELSVAIDQLMVYESLQSMEQIREVRSIIHDLHDAFDTWGRYSNDTYYAELQLRTANYADLLTYEQNFEELVSSCMTECRNCGGDGWISQSCSSCGGAGKKLVKWYSQGNWGTTSYTSYTCTSCDGAGRMLSNCSNCTDGYIYHFDTASQPANDNTDDNSGESFYTLGEDLLEKEDYSGAMEAFSSAAELGYSDASQMATYCGAIDAAETLGMYEDAIEAFTELGDFKDSSQMAAYYLGRYHEAAAIIHSTVSEASDDELNLSKISYEQAIESYAALSFKDSMNRIAVCQEQVYAIEAEQSVREKAAETEAAYQRATTLEAEGDYSEALDLFMALNDYKDSAERAATCQSSIQAAKIEATYQDALALEGAGKYKEAIDTFETLDGYRDSVEHIAVCKAEMKEAEYQLATSHWLAGEYENALVLYEQLDNYKDSKRYLLLIEDLAKPVDEIGQMCDGRARVRRDDKWGYVDENGRPVIACQYSHAADFAEGLAPVATPVADGYKCSYIDRDGNEVITTPYTTISTFSEGLSCVAKDGKYGFIDVTGQVVIPLEYEKAWSFSNGFAWVRKNNRLGFIDTTGRLIGDCIYYGANDFSEGYAIVKTSESEWSFIDTKGNLQMEPGKYNQIYNFSDGMARVKIRGESAFSNLYGYINTAGELVIPCEYDTDANDFSEGLASVRKDNSWYVFIDETNTVMLEGNFGYADTFHYGVAIVSSKGKHGLIDKTGKQIVPFEYDDASDPVDGLIIVEKNKKQGYIDTAGNVLIPCSYDMITYHDGCFVLMANGLVSTIYRETLQPGYQEMLRQYDQEREERLLLKKMLVVYTNKETIRSAQIALNDAGYDCGKPDGIAGKGTAAAVTNYQTDKGLNVTGTITRELLISLGIIES